MRFNLKKPVGQLKIREVGTVLRALTVLLDEPDGWSSESTVAEVIDRYRNHLVTYTANTKKATQPAQNRPKIIAK